MGAGRMRAKSDQLRTFVSMVPELSLSNRSKALLQYLTSAAFMNIGSAPSFSLDKPKLFLIA